jgi:proline dehydrogenase
LSVKLTALGLDIDPALALDNALQIVDVARTVGATVTIDMEDHTRTDATLHAVAELRRVDHSVGAVVQAYLRRTESDCHELARAGSRVRLCKGAYREPAALAYRRTSDIRASYSRWLQILMRGAGYPMMATHDPRMIELTDDLARTLGRAADSYEYQMLYGVRPLEQRRLAAAGCSVRVYIPYGSDWSGYLMRRIAERPANLKFFVRSVRSYR